jgi:cytochrome c5
VKTFCPNLLVCGPKLAGFCHLFRGHFMRLFLGLLSALLVASCSDAPAPGVAEPASPIEPAPDPALVAGEAIVKANCFVCHAQGINGAPIIGNHKMWGPRAGQGLNTLVSHAMSGYGLMPAKGGNEELQEEDIRLAVGYMLSQLEK